MKKRRKIRIGCRPSRLAIAQAKEAMRCLRGVTCELITLPTDGDRDKVTPLTDGVADNFFTHDIEKALLRGKIDAAVHSAKDLEGNIPEGLVIAAVTRSISPFECLVSRDGLKLAELHWGAIIGTSSLKRRRAVRQFRADFMVKSIRGDIEERIRQLDEGAFDAIIVAHAALIRLGLKSRIAEIIPQHVIEPHPLQGRLAVQVRKDRTDLINIFRRFDDK